MKSSQDMELGEKSSEEWVEFENPTSAGEQMSTAQMVAANEAEMSEAELADLSYAFQAADMDGGGAIDIEEFRMMLAVMGCDITEDQIKGIVTDAKDGFNAWKKKADQENIDKCKRIWDQYDEDKSGTMDLKEVTAVIDKLRELGADPEPFTEADMGDGELDFDEFCSWYLKQEGLPDSFAPPKPGATPKAQGGSVLFNNPLTKGVGMALGPFAKLSKVAISGPAHLLSASAHMIHLGNKHDPESEDFDPAAAAAAAEAKMKAGEELIFAEYVFMMRSGALKQYLPGDWQERAEDMCKLRDAFNSADVDGDNQLEFEELEMCIMSMNPKADIQPSEIKKVWEVLNPDGKDWIPYGEFVKGMITVKRDPELSRVIPLDVPNRFMLLSLLIDTPINEDQEKLIFSKLSALEKWGLKMLAGMGKPPMERAEIKSMLQYACQGRLHFLTDEQRQNVNSTHYNAVFQAFCIGTIFTLFPGMLENFLVYAYETDGAVDAYWMCPHTLGGDGEPLGDPTAAPWGIGNLTLPYCPPKLRTQCTTVPKDAQAYIDAGGNFDMGGTWDEPAEYGGTTASPLRKCSILPGQSHDCDFGCTKLGLTGLRDHPSMIKFWVFNVIGIVVGIIFELSLLMFTALRGAVQVSTAIDLRLTPLNNDRAKVGGMLVRTTFELPDPEDDSLGVDATGGDDSGRNPILNVLAVLFIKGKVVLTGVGFKQITARLSFVPYSTATWIKPYTGTSLACALWDSMMCHAIMKNATIRAVGVTTAIEVFNEIVDTYCPKYEDEPDTLSEEARVQFLRAIGVAIVKNGSMFPTMELMLRHAVNYFNMKKSKAVTSSGVLDDEDKFIEDFDKITLDESRAVLCVHMLCYILDGDIGFSELSLWKRLLARVEELYQVERAKFDSYTTEDMRAFIIEKQENLTTAVGKVAVGDPDEMMELQDLAKSVPQPETATRYDGLIPRHICQRFRANVPVDCEIIQATWDPEENRDYMSETLTPDQITKFTVNEFLYKVMSLLTKQI